MSVEILTAEKVAKWRTIAVLEWLPISHEALRAERDHWKSIYDALLQGSTAQNVATLMDEADKARAEIERWMKGAQAWQLCAEDWSQQYLDQQARIAELEKDNAALHEKAEAASEEVSLRDIRIAGMEKSLRWVAWVGTITPCPFCDGSGNTAQGSCCRIPGHAKACGCALCQWKNACQRWETRIAELEKEMSTKEKKIEELIEYGAQIAATRIEWMKKAQELVKERDAAIAERDGLRRAIERLEITDGCWCDTGEGNPHTSQCRNMNATIADLDVGRPLAAVPAPTREDDGRLDAIREALTILNELPYIKDNPVDRAITILIATATAVPAPAVNANKKTGPHVVCSICGSPAEFIEAEGVYRHKGDSHDDRYIAQILCDKYGYPIQVVAAVPAPSLPESPFIATLRELIATTPDEAELKRQIVNAVEGPNMTINAPAPRPLTEAELKRWSRDRMEGLGDKSGRMEYR